MIARGLVVALLTFSALAAAAPPGGLVTIADGEAILLRGVAKAAVVEGLRLAAGDIVETSAAARLLQLELDDGLLVDLGPSTRLQLAPRLAGEPARRGARLYLLQGWLKLSAGAAPADGTLVATAALDLVSLKRSAVLAVTGTELALFAESGELGYVERGSKGGKGSPAQVLKPGEFLTRSGNDKPAVAGRPSPVFVQQVPRPFLDTLPARAKQFAGRELPPKSLGAIAYDDVQPWIDAEPALRGGFVLRWRLLARQPEFRQRLQQTMAAHPEWDPLLNPDKYSSPGASAPPVRHVSPLSTPTPR